MNYTREQLVNMSDHEVNLAVAKKLDNGYADDGFNRVTKVGKTRGGNHYTREFAPCERWNDAMPIAERYGIHVSFDVYPNTTDICASSDLFDDNPVSSENKNPRRAICEVFLMMED